jgi:NAD+ synthase (glutamine-hydrolysing)
MKTQASIRVALAQMNSCVGAFEQNAARILQFTGKALAEGAELIIFPELALSSYPCLDLIDRDDFREKHAQTLSKLVSELVSVLRPGSYAIVGAFTPNQSSHGRLVRNSALVIGNSGLQYEQRKQLLPSYDVFDENRYFEPGEPAGPWQSALGPLGISVCEDAWFEDLHKGRLLYEVDPAVFLKGSRLAINLSASPFLFGKQERRDQVISGFAERIGAPLLYVNQVGANDEILFDGDSRIFSKTGQCLLVAPSFIEGLLVADLRPESDQVADPKFLIAEKGKSGSVATWQNAPALLEAADSVVWTADPRKQPALGRLRAVDQAMASEDPNHAAPASVVAKKIQGQNRNEMKLVARGLELGIKDYFVKSGFQSAVIGLSGGIDSAVVATLAARALGPSNVYGVSMPSKYSSAHSLEDAQALAQALGINYGAASIKFVNSALLMELRPHFKGAAEDLTEENLQSRLRGTILMAIANKSRALVLATGNKSEMAVGYCTLYGDMCGALAPIGDLYKTKVYELAHYLNSEGNVIPQSTIDKPPSAELRPNQTDQDSLPPYDILDEILRKHLEEGAGHQSLEAHGFDPGIVQQVLALVRNSEFKRRQAAPVLKVTTKAFGLGRRYPVVRGF